MRVCISTYMLASGLIAGGMNWWQAVGGILLGKLIVLIPMLLNAHAGAALRQPVSRVCPRLLFPVLGAEHVRRVARYRHDQDPRRHRRAVHARRRILHPAPVSDMAELKIGIDFLHKVIAMTMTFFLRD